MISGQLFRLLCEKRPSVYVEVDLYGLPGDSRKKMFKTRTVMSDGLNTIFDDLRDYSVGAGATSAVADSYGTADGSGSGRSNRFTMEKVLCLYVDEL